MVARLQVVAAVLVLSFILAGCGVELQGNPPIFTELPAPTSTATPTPLPTPTLTPLPPAGVLWAPPGGDRQLESEIQSRLSQWIPEAGYRFQVRPELNPGSLEGDDIQLVVGLAPNPELGEIARRYPAIRFLSVGIQGLEPGPNLSTIGAGGNRLDYQGFIAGYMAAMITPDWRVGVIGYTDNEDTVAARQAFYTGVKFYCGLCRSTYPPYYEYPMFFELGSEADTLGWQAAADYMIQRAVETVYVVPGAGDEAMLRHLAEAEVNIIAGVSPITDLSDHWVASLRFDLLESFIEHWPEFLAGSSPVDREIPIQIMDVNPDLLSPGKLRLVQTTMEEVLAGRVDLGVTSQDNP
jgi:hypothetical protein